MMDKISTELTTVLEKRIPELEKENFMIELTDGKQKVNPKAKAICDLLTKAIDLESLELDKLKNEQQKVESAHKEELERMKLEYTSREQDRNYEIEKLKLEVEKMRLGQNIISENAKNEIERLKFEHQCELDAIENLRKDENDKIQYMRDWLTYVGDKAVDVVSVGLPIIAGVTVFTMGMEQEATGSITMSPDKAIMQAMVRMITNFKSIF